MKKTWWKILCVVILLYTIIQGLGGIVPRQPILNETIRNVFPRTAVVWNDGINDRFNVVCNKVFTQWKHRR